MVLKMVRAGAIDPADVRKLPDGRKYLTTNPEHGRKNEEKGRIADHCPFVGVHEHQSFVLRRARRNVFENHQELSWFERTGLNVSVKAW
jgi:hypothetical protein